MKNRRITVIVGILGFAVALLGGPSSLAAPELPEGWFKAGSFKTGAPDDYQVGVAPAAGLDGGACAFIRAKGDSPTGFGTLMQVFAADQYRGKRLRMSGHVKVKGVVGWAGLWMRVDGPDPERSLGFDNMGDRPIKGVRRWQRYEIVLDVPEEATDIAFGILLRGAGQAWLDELEFEEVGQEIAMTDMPTGPARMHPVNLDFEEPNSQGKEASP